VTSAPLALPALWPWGDGFWLLAGPVGFLATGWWYRRQQTCSGVGEGRGSYTRDYGLLDDLGPPIVFVALGALLLAGGLVALRRERAGR
jgi:hypothetical protein